MPKISFKGQPAHTIGNSPEVGQSVSFSKLVRNDLSEISLDAFAGKTKVFNIFPSIDTGICAASVRRFSKEAATLKNTVVLNVSADLPFANSRFCGAEGISNCETLSTFRSSFAKDWGLQLVDSPLAGLLARAVLVVSPQNKVIYREVVSELTQEPNYEAALKAVPSI